jgi:ribonucleoside-diphosphate reductase subunit M2
MSESPVKKLQFQAAGKENVPFEADAPTVAVDVDVKKPVEEVKQEKAIVVAPTIKPDESDEPLLQENPNRFVLFPIKYHEVRVASRRVTRKVFQKLTIATDLADVQEGRGILLDCRGN